ncbi:UDP-N-acetylmuramoyl-L-alanine--D-glutamate ligase [Allohahella sp. A8]|uniref:UDP-N-acetylmuramoyl-L-alanine--D-glutamate ligase n=1 Tax=Allohahella sp. A8 TaxID=3141461 RepID=UPI000C0BA970|nr:UDP-N-acetylmuramoyl-L-alanine--D-glutamate ligase [Hahellaceae bacterium]
MSILAADKAVAIIGAGVTGQSLLRYARSRAYQVVLMDTRAETLAFTQLKLAWPEVTFHFGGLHEAWLRQADEIWVSPGIDLRQALLKELAEVKPLRGDIDLFSEAAAAPVAAITGSNGKSTVTTLLHAMAQACGLHSVAGGNLGTPALDLLDPKVELYVLEVSSFQLETTRHLGAAAATVLNLSQDHMDRYDNMLAYHNAKIRVFNGARKMVLNRDDPLAQAPLSRDRSAIGFTSREPEPNDYGLRNEDGQWHLAKGRTLLLPTTELKIQGRHNWLNALAALALAEQLELDQAACLSALKQYIGLPHRCAFVAEVDGVVYINDSKATNVGAALAAVDGFSTEYAGRIHLLCGGDGKGQDFTPLAKVSRQLASAHLYGRDAVLVQGAFSANNQRPASLTISQDLATALETARAEAKPGDLILLSPACASFDQFTGYEDRGAKFASMVGRLGA